MKVLFNRNSEIEVHVGFDERDEPICVQKLFRKGQVIELTSICHPQTHDSEKGLTEDSSSWDLQFPDGSFALCVGRNLIDLT